MTREEAIAIIEKECVNRANKNDYCNRDCYNCELVKTNTEILIALDMAIKALEKEPTDDATLKDIFCMGCEYKEQEPCDAISRQAAIDLANELKDDLPDDDHLSDMVMSHNEGVLEYQTKLSLLPPVTPQLEKIRVANIHFDEEKFEKIMKNAPLTILDDSNTPTIQLIQPKTGHWIFIGNSDVNGLKICECDVCGKRTYGSHNFCPNCGAKMVEPQESEDK